MRLPTVMLDQPREACAEIRRRIGLTSDAEEERLPESIEWGRYPEGLLVIKGEPLFPRLK